MYGDSFTPPVPALYVDALLSKRGELTLKGSVTRNYRYPTLNDLYFMPGRQPRSTTRKGISYDAGLSTHVRRQRLDFSAAATWFDSYIDDWILLARNAQRLLDTAQHQASAQLRHRVAGIAVGNMVAKIGR